MVKDKQNDDIINGQTRHKCLTVKCGKMGRLIGKLGDIKLTYCAVHRGYGVRVLDFMIDSILRDKLSTLLEETRKDLFLENKPEICKECEKKIADYVMSMTNQVAEIKRLDKLKKTKVK